MNHHHHDHRCADDCSDQLPLISRVGRGIHGDDFIVEIESDSETETILEGLSYDHATKEYKSEWLSENINGGQLSYQYVLRPYTVPQTFTITFIYRRPGRAEWSWTTPAIPYIWSASDTGEPEDPDHIVGSGVATLFIRKTTEEEWHEKLVYPEGTTRDDYNAPEAEEPWTVNLAFGVGGDVEVPNIDDIAKIIGISVGDIKKIIAGQTVVIDGLTVSNVIDLIKKADARVLDHVHKDLGFNSSGHGDTGAFGGQDTVKKYIDSEIAKLKSDIETEIKNLGDEIKATLQDIVDKIYGGGTIGDDGHITWPNNSKVPVADLNIFSTSSPSESTFTDSIRSRSLSDDDIKTV